MYFQKNGNSEGRGGSRLWNSQGMGGDNAFWNFRRQGEVKTWKPSVVGYGYFLELPNISLSMSINQYQINIELPYLWYIVVLLPQK